jgi:hypothetical protein
MITNARKRTNPGKSVFTFAGGSRKLYDIIHRNQDIHVYPVDYTNLPHNIMQNDKVVSINNTTQIDLQGQAASESAGTGTSAAPAASCSSCAAPMPRTAARASSACPRPTTRRASRRAASSPC